MKTFLLIVFLFSYSILFGQTGISLKNNVQLISTPQGSTTNIPRPFSRSKAIKFKTKPLCENSEINFHMEEYINGKIVHNPLSKIHWVREKKGGTIVCEVIPDLTISQNLHLFLNAPGVTYHREKKTNLPKFFDYKIYKKTKTEEYDSIIPILLIYEDDYSNRNTTKLVNNYLDQDSLKTTSNSQLLAQIERYFLVYYQFIKTKTDE